MKGIFLLALVGVTRIGGQTTHSTGAFSYQGCSSIDPSCFGDLIVFSDGRLIPESCQLACQGHQFAALLPDSCRCGDDANGIHLIDDAKCDYPCMGDSSLGMCGSICPEKTSAIANIYTRVTPSQGPAYGDPTSVESSAAAVETSCSPTDASSVGEPPQSSRRITPEGPAPEVPTSFGNPAATETPAPGSPSTQAPQEPPCETQSNTGLSTPSHGPQDPHDPQGPLTPPGSAPEPKTVNQPLPSTTPSANAPKYSSECQSPRPDSYSGEAIPGGVPGKIPGGDPLVDNCDPASGPSLSPVVAESTLWPWPSKKPEGDPPIPSRVPASDSTCGVIPTLYSIGGVVLLAAMIM